MRESFSDFLRKISEEKPTRRPSWKRLRGALWLAHAIEKSGLSADEFASRYIHRGRSRSYLVAKWLAGDVVPNGLSARELEKNLPGTVAIFDLPFTLLANRPLSLRALQALIVRYRRPHEWGFIWTFPDSELDTHCLLPAETHGLLERADLWGLFGILALVREAEAGGDDATHVALCKDLYRALVPLVKIPWIAPSIPQFKECFGAIRERCHFSSLMFDVDWPALEAGRTDIILNAKIIPGTEVRNHERKKQERAAKRRRSRQ